MSHQPFETFLLSKETINAQQQQQLDRHLTSCEPCSTLAAALTDLDELFANSPAPNPAPGFTQRWQVRLSAYRQKRQNRNLWFMAIGLFSLAWLIILLILTYHLQSINLAYELSQWIARASRLTAEVRSSLNLFHSLINFLPFMIPIMLVFGSGTLLALTALTLTWFSAIFKLYSPIRERGNLS
jgi:hypothetical protein